MLVINKITCAAAFAAASLGLWGCSSAKTPEGGGDQNDNGVTLDQNGIPSDAAASTKAVAGILGDGLYRNYEQCPPKEGRDTAFIAKALGAVVAQTKREVGDDDAVDKILAEWKNGEAVPVPAGNAVHGILEKNVLGDGYEIGKLDPDIWDAEHAGKAATIIRFPALNAIKNFIREQFKENGLPCDDDTVNAALGAAAAAIDAANGAGTTDAALEQWKCGEAVPDAVVSAVADAVAAAKQQQ